MNEIIANIALILLFIVIGGVFAAAEMALVSLRESQIKQLSEKSKRGKTVARLASDPNLFLSAVQIGVTLSGFLSAAFGGALLSDKLAGVFVGWGMLESVASPLALVLITIVISYFSIVIGELTSKRLAMQNAESFALALGPFVAAIAKVARPVIWLLGVSTNGLVRLLGGNPEAAREEVSEEELRAMVGASETLTAQERKIVDEVFSAGDVSLREVMRPRTEVDFIDGAETCASAFAEAKTLSHSRFPVTGRDTDDILGFIHIRDFLSLSPRQLEEPVRLRVRKIDAYPQSLNVLTALAQLRESNNQIAIVKDEYGGTAGIVTLEDLVEELIGEISDEFDLVEPERAATEGSVELDGLTTIEDFGERFGYVLPEGPYDTVAGFVMAQLGDLPQRGDRVEVELEGEGGTKARVVMEVTELDGRRAARVRCTKLAEIEPDEEE
ncbi:MAG: hemolysin family protein [Propionibacteriaceae bacterium]|jgi:putative hemolysin|nr:hemolysin family protein [Propionibacteriaceae bacterium]